MSKQDRNGCVGVPPNGDDAYACKCFSHRRDYFGSDSAAGIFEAFMEHLSDDSDVEVVEFSGQVRRSATDEGRHGVRVQFACKMSVRDFGGGNFFEFELDR